MVLDNSTPQIGLFLESDGRLSGRGVSRDAMPPTLDNYGLLSAMRAKSQNNHLGMVIIGLPSKRFSSKGSPLLNSFLDSWANERIRNTLPNLVSLPNQGLGTNLLLEWADNPTEINLSEPAQETPLQPIDKTTKTTRPTESPVNGTTETTVSRQHPSKQKIGLQATKFDAKYGFVELSDPLLFGGGVSQRRNAKQMKKPDLVLHYLADKAQRFEIPQIEPVPFLAEINLTENAETILQQAVLSVQDLSVDENTLDENTASNQHTSDQRTVEHSSAQSISTAHSTSRSRQAQMLQQPEAKRLQRIQNQVAMLTKTVETLSHKISKISA